MNEVLKEALFDLHQFSKAITCENCGKNFSPRQKSQTKYCSSKCKKAFFHRKTKEQIKARFQQIQHSEVPLPEKLTEKDKVAVHLYGNRKGLGTIARTLEESKTNVRRRLIYAGVYKPKPEQNTLARKGTGKFSKVLQRERIEKRKDQWRHRMAVCLWNLRRGIKIEATCKSEGWSSKGIWRRLKDKQTLLGWISSHSSNLEDISDHRQIRILRHKIAVCLWNFHRRKIAVETLCHSKGWNPSLVWNYLHKCKAYKKLKAARPSKPYNAQQYQYTHKNKWRSKTYATEDDFQNVIETLLVKFGIKYIREKRLPSGKKVDFELSSAVCLECKVSTKASGFFRGIGQAFAYKDQKRDAWFVLPDDVQVDRHQLKLLEQNQVVVFKEADFRGKLEIGEISQSLTKIIRAQNLS